MVKKNFVENRLFHAQKHMLEGIIRYLKKSRYLVCQIKRMKKPKELQNSTWLMVLHHQSSAELGEQPTYCNVKCSSSL